ncbi:MAG TPA: hypothetical protein VFQ70_00705 [Candidatus Saccharimonadaceae bacterium]|nr:hypothetical protein [Candidatus Saccharimonadaceae bacterium]
MYPDQPQPPVVPSTPSPAAPVFYAPAEKKSHQWLWIGIAGLLLILFIAAGSVAIWAYEKYQTASTNVNAQIDKASLAAAKKQSDSDESKFEQLEKKPNKLFVGPDNYGRVTFDYPKTWSAYVASDVSSNGGTYSAYLNPGVVPPVDAVSASGLPQQFALRVTIDQNTYSNELQNYQGQIQNGVMTDSSFTVNGHTGTRLDGTFPDGIRGSAVLFQIRDKVLTVRTDANTFDGDFNTIIKSINFND